LLDKVAQVIESLDIIKGSYVKLTMLKEREREAQDAGDYEFLYELSENERVLIENINESLKFIVPDLITLRGDSKVRMLLAEIDELHESVISETLKIRTDLKKSISRTEIQLQDMKVFPQSPVPPPNILNLRA
jgi:hypothetical protein